MNKILSEAGKTFLNVKTYILIGTVIAFYPSLTLAQQSENINRTERTILISTKDGEHLELAIKEGQIITFDDKNLFLSSPETEMTFPTDNIEKWSYSSRIYSEVEKFETKGKISMQGSMIQVEGMEGQSFRAFSLKGNILFEHTMNDFYSIDLNYFGEEQLIILIGKHSLKFQK